MQRTAEIIICPDCKGEGTVSQRITLYDSDHIICTRCGGKRVLSKVTEVRFEPVEPIKRSEDK